MRISLAALIAAAALAGAACASDEDQAAKARIFSPEDPPKVLQAAAEPIDAGNLHTDAGRIDRVFAISAQEAAARIGAHVQEAKVSFRWVAGGREVKLAEERMVALGADGDFHARILNDEKRGMEWVKVDGISYSRSRYAKFRERRRDRGSSEHVVASAYSTLTTFHDWVHGAIALSNAGETTVDGRAAVKYRVALGEARAIEEADLPAIVFPRDGPDAETALRLLALEQGRPQSVTGTLVVDAATGVPLQADLQAAVVVPSEQGESRLELSVKLEVKKHDGTIAVPEHVDDAPRPPGVVATLDAYGIPRAGAAEAAAEKSGEQPPPDEE